MIRQQQKERGKNRYISPNCPEARRIGRDVGCDEFFGNRLTGVDFVGGGGEFCHFPSTSPVALTQGWCYRAACILIVAFYDATIKICGISIDEGILGLQLKTSGMSETWCVSS